MVLNPGSRFAVVCALFMVLGAFHGIPSSVKALSPQEKKEKIGTVFSKPVYREDLKTSKDQTLEAELHRLFLEPVYAKFLKENRAKIEPNDKEIDQVADYFAKKFKDELKGNPKDFARFMLSNWKLQKHLYDNYGGGRILWQQAGQEAFDATRTWLESREKAGDFEVSDPKLKETMLLYWNKSHGAFLTADKERIRKEFLEPEWYPKAKGK